MSLRRLVTDSGSRAARPRSARSRRSGGRQEGAIGEEAGNPRLQPADQGDAADPEAFGEQAQPRRAPENRQAGPQAGAPAPVRLHQDAEALQEAAQARARAPQPRPQPHADGGLAPRAAGRASRDAQRRAAPVAEVEALRRWTEESRHRGEVDGALERRAPAQDADPASPAAVRLPPGRRQGLSRDGDGGHGRLGRHRAARPPDEEHVLRHPGGRERRRRREQREELHDPGRRAVSAPGTAGGPGPADPEAAHRHVHGAAVRDQRQGLQLEARGSRPPPSTAARWARCATSRPERSAPPAASTSPRATS